MISPLLISTAAYVSTLAAGIIAAVIVAVTACYLQTKKFKVTEVFADRSAKAKNPLKKRKKDTHRSDVEPSYGGTPYCRIGHLSDLHFPMVSVNLGDVIYRIASEDCDALAITGDLCQNAKGKPAMLDFMRTLSDALEGLPILVVLGNHDCTHVCGKDPKKIAEYVKEVESCGRNIKVLRDETVKIRLKGTDASIVAAGLDELCIGDDKKHKKAVSEAAAEASENDKLLILMHNPDLMEVVKDEISGCGKYSVTLAGHTHGGQAYMPFNFEFNVLRDDRMPRKGYVYGLYEYCENNKLYINCGLGQSYLPLRLGTAPEIAFVCF